MIHKRVCFSCVAMVGCWLGLIHALDKKGSGMKKIYKSFVSTIVIFLIIGRQTVCSDDQTFTIFDEDSIAAVCAVWSCDVQYHAEFTSLSRPSFSVCTNYGDLSALTERFDVACYTLENLRNNRIKAAYPNQDRAGVASDNTRYLFSVLDGHGTYGDRVAEKVRELLRTKILHMRAKETLENIFEDVQGELEREGYTQNSGTTAVIALIQDGALTLAHAGDSRAVLIRDGKIAYETKDHKPSDPAEQIRLINKSGHVFQPDFRNHPGRYRVVHRDKIWDQSASHYAFSRGFGDFSSDGVIAPEPDISVSLPLQENDTLVLATDGVWDEISPQSLIKYAQIPAADLAELMVQSARSYGSFDDSTALVVRVGALAKNKS